MKKIIQRNVEGREGFTLIELLLVLAIIGMLSAIVAVKLTGKSLPAMIKTTRASIAATGVAIDAYEVDTGRLPTSLQNLMTSSGEPNWDGPYIKGGSLPADSWGTPLQYTAKDAKTYEIRSAAQDLKIGTEDDITN